MILSISTTHQPATDLGFLLMKHPDRIHSTELPFGRASVAFPEAQPERCTACLFLEIDPIRLVRRPGEAHGTLGQFVNDRPYVANSFLSVALNEVYGTAMSGRSRERAELAETPIPLEVHLPVLPAPGGEDLIRRLFEPLGYGLEIQRLPLDPEFPEWGTSRYYDVRMRGTLRLSEVLRHLYLLIPALDARKHYYLERQEVDKIFAKGSGWIETHPERNWILRASLGRKPSLLREAMEQLANLEEDLLPEAESTPEKEPEVRRKAGSLHQLRHERIVEWVREQRPKSVLDLGCGEGKLLRKLIPIKGVERIVGMEVSYYELERARRSLRLEDAPPALAERVNLIHGSLLYLDDRLKGFDVCAIVEVIEHMEPGRLSAFERVVFGHASPRSVLLTTPNREYNAVYGVEELRHSDHRFEWTRAEFETWATGVAERHGYTVEFEGLGPEVEPYGAPSQMGVFTKCE